MKKTALFVLLVGIVIQGCSLSSTGRKQITFYSAEELNKMGSESFEQMKTEIPISNDQVTNLYVNCVANAITRNVPTTTFDGQWEVVVFNSDQVNAFALPGGKIGVYTGILEVANTQDQLGAIIGHEVGHVIEQHSNERLSSGALSQTGLAIVNSVLESNNVSNQNNIMAGLGVGLQYGVLMPYGRKHESEADIVGQLLMAKSGFNPAASIVLWQNMGKLSDGAPPEILSTHPSGDTRIKQLQANLSKARAVYDTDKTPNCMKP